MIHKICLVGCVRMRNAVDTKNQGSFAGPWGFHPSQFLRSRQQERDVVATEKNQKSENADIIFEVLRVKAHRGYNHADAFDGAA